MLVRVGECDSPQPAARLVLATRGAIGPYCDGKARHWVADWTTDSRQPWLDSYLLTGTELLHNDDGRRSAGGQRRV